MSGVGTLCAIAHYRASLCLFLNTTKGIFKQNSRQNHKVAKSKKNSSEPFLYAKDKKFAKKTFEYFPCSVENLVFSNLFFTKQRLELGNIIFITFRKKILEEILPIYICISFLKHIWLNSHPIQLKFFEAVNFYKKLASSAKLHSMKY